MGLTRLANQIKDFLKDSYQETGQCVFWPQHVFNHEPLKEVMDAFLELEEKGFVTARIEIECPEGHEVFSGGRLEASKLRTKNYYECLECYEQTTFENEDMDFFVSFSISDAWSESVKKKVTQALSAQQPDLGELSSGRTEPSVPKREALPISITNNFFGDYVSDSNNISGNNGPVVANLGSGSHSIEDVQVKVFQSEVEVDEEEFQKDVVEVLNAIVERIDKSNLEQSTKLVSVFNEVKKLNVSGKKCEELWDMISDLWSREMQEDFKTSIQKHGEEVVKITAGTLFGKLM
ncbi:hypothetical protein FRC91_20100 [Bradymonadales bacterium TMQ1]|nr:hypothetical protein FRC91_20100 [Bradymonadales bacterium TMQ1]